MGQDEGKHIRDISVWGRWSEKYKTGKGQLEKLNYGGINSGHTEKRKRQPNTKNPKKRKSKRDTGDGHELGKGRDGGGGGGGGWGGGVP